MLADEPAGPPDLSGAPSEWSALGVSFVTLERSERLLGCVGVLEPVRPLAYDVAKHAVGAAFEDPRVPAVTIGDFEVMSVKVSVLSRLWPLAVSSCAELASGPAPNVDGLLIEAGRHRATFLPSVWAKVPDADAFITALWQKAALPAGVWPVRMTVSTYTTAEQSDPGPRAFAAANPR